MRHLHALAHSLPLAAAIGLLLATAAVPTALAADPPAAPDERAVGPVTLSVGGDDLAIGNCRLLAIGIDEYLSRDLRLQTAVAGARALRDLLVKDFTFHPDHCQLLLDAQATRAGVLAALRALAAAAGPTDSLLVYYAGHGHVDPLTKEGSWIPADATGATPDKWIGNDEIKKLLAVTKARHVLLISDSCFAGDFFRGSRDVAVPATTPASVRQAFSRASRSAITAGGLEPVADGGKDGQSIFTYWLLSALREETTPYLLPEAVYDRLKGAVGANAKQSPQFGLLHGAGGEPDGTFIFFRRGVATVDAAMKARDERIAALAKLDAQAAAEARRREEEIALKQAQLKAMDAKIAELQRKLGGGAGTSDLAAIVAIVKAREQEEKDLAELRRKAEEELCKREEQLAAARAAHEAAQKTKFGKDYADFQYVAGSKFSSPELVAQSWAILCRDWAIPATAKPTDQLAYREGRVQVGPPAPPPPPPSKGPVVGQPFTIADLGLALVPVKAGKFQMGSPAGEKDRDDDETQHDVTLTRDFWLGQTEVTRGQFAAFVQTTKHQTTAENEGSAFAVDGQGKWGDTKGATWQQPGFSQTDEHPVVCVSWDDAVAFCRWLTERERKAGRLLGGQVYRLPTEAEWEYACRAGTRTAYAWAANPADGKGWANAADQSAKRQFPNWTVFPWDDGSVYTAPVKQFKANAWGLHDLHGNVWEWCADWYGAYPTGASNDPKGPNDGASRVLRGGSFSDAPGCVRCAFRDGLHPAGRGARGGFRVCLGGGG